MAVALGVVVGADRRSCSHKVGRFLHGVDIDSLTVAYARLCLVCDRTIWFIVECCCKLQQGLIRCLYLWQGYCLGLCLGPRIEKENTLAVAV